jgi:hypothetical protein
MGVVSMVAESLRLAAGFHCSLAHAVPAGGGARGRPATARWVLTQSVALVAEIHCSLAFPTGAGARLC